MQAAFGSSERWWSINSAGDEQAETGRSVKLHGPDPLPSTAEKALHTAHKDARFKKGRPVGSTVCEAEEADRPACSPHSAVLLMQAAERHRSGGILNCCVE